jgi:hypothetical protein
MYINTVPFHHPFYVWVSEQQMMALLCFGFGFGVVLGGLAGGAIFLLGLVTLIISSFSEYHRPIHTIHPHIPTYAFYTCASM